MISERVAERFWARVHVREPDRCWPWVRGAVNNAGYGAFRVNGKPEGAHRVAWMIAYGLIPKGAYVIHHCDIKLCCNPRHLHLGDASLNQIEAIERNLFSPPSPPLQNGELHSQAKLTEIDVLEIHRLAATGLATGKRLARMFRVSRGHISRIVNRKNWGHL